MRCPKCQSEMEAVTIEKVEINRCTNCKGLWFDEFELSDLKAAKGSEVIDTGDAKVGGKPGRQDRLLCPRCSDPMIRMVDSDHPHIWYETCDECGGSFVDAGEFREMKKTNLISKIKDVLAEMKGGRETRPVKLSAEVIRKILS